MMSIVFSLVPVALIASGFVYWKVNLFHVIGFFLLPLVLRQVCLNPQVVRNRWFAFFCFSLLYYSIASFWAAKPILSIYYIAQMLNGVFLVLVIFLCFSDDKLIDKIYRSVLWVFVFIISFGFIETLQYLKWPISRFSSLNPIFGLDPKYQVYELKLQKYFNEIPESYNFVMSQPTVFYWEPNRFSLVVAILFPFAFVPMKSSVGRGFLLGLSCYLLLMASSRAVIFSFLISILLMVFLLISVQKEKLRHLLKSLGAASLVIVAAFSAFHLFARTDFGGERFGKLSSVFIAMEYYISDGTDLEDADSSSMKRLDLARKGIQSFVESPFFGVGPGNSLQKSQSLFGQTNLHNFWLEILVEGGLVYALSAFIYLLSIFAVLGKITSFPAKERTRAISILVSLVSLIPAVLAVGTPVYIMTFWFSIGMAAAFCWRIGLKKDEDILKLHS